MNKQWYTISNIKEIDTPALVIYPDRVKQNIEILKSFIDDPQRLRPHVKTHKTKEAALLLMEAGINKFKCATIAEAEMLGSIQAADVLLAYQPVGPKTDRFISLIKNYTDTKFSCLVDDRITAEYISNAALKAGIIIPVYIDLNIGMNRTGIDPAKALELYEACSQIKGVTLLGLHAYDGHISDPDLVVREKQCEEAFAAVDELRDAIIEKGFAEPIIIAGGSPTFPLHAKRKKVECSPGTFIFWDASYELFTEQPFLPAALVITRIISHPTETGYCADLGHKSVAAEKELTNRVKFINLPGAQSTGQSEEHLVLQTEEGSLQIGDVLYGMPFHICPTCALYEKAFTVEGGKVTGEWKIVARDRKISL
jgi:D-serine deaminase-like pyridoxal phosphate-dependent protein